MPKQQKTIFQEAVETYAKKYHVSIEEANRLIGEHNTEMVDKGVPNAEKSGKFDEIFVKTEIHQKDDNKENKG